MTDTNELEGSSVNLGYPDIVHILGDKLKPNELYSSFIQAGACNEDLVLKRKSY